MYFNQNPGNFIPDESSVVLQIMGETPNCILKFKVKFTALELGTN